jgi:N-acyl-D-amino-acid deacylase
MTTHFHPRAQVPGSGKDLLITNARILDGTGAPWFLGHVVLSQGRIGAVLDRRPDGWDGDVLDAQGMWLAPGFVDAHTHDDLAFLRDGILPEKTLQGVTTIVVGNCSFAPYPYAPGKADLTAGHFGSLLGQLGDEEVFPDAAAYLAAVTTRGIAPNVVSLAGHGPIRLAVMGYDKRPATADERSQMEAILAAQLDGGAVGLSLGLVYPPSSWADDPELLGLSRVVADHGRLLTAHVRSYDNDVEASIAEFIGLLRNSGARGLLSHLQIAGTRNWGRMAGLLAMLEQARAEGIDISCDMYPYTAGSSTILQLLPPSAQEGGIDAVIARLNDPAERAALKDIIDEKRPGDPLWSSKVGQIGWDNIRIGGVEVASHKHYEGQTLAALGQASGVDPFEVTSDLIECDCGRTNIVMFQQSEEDLGHVLAHRLHMTGSDSIPRHGGKPHPRAAGSFVRLLAASLAPRAAVPLEERVRRMTSLPAQRFSLFDRGTIRPGQAADLVLFCSSVRDRATYDDPRLPPDGIQHVFVAGQKIVQGGSPTGLRPGTALPKP